MEEKQKFEEKKKNLKITKDKTKNALIQGLHDGSLHKAVDIMEGGKRKFITRSDYNSQNELFLAKKDSSK